MTTARRTAALAAWPPSSAVKCRNDSGGRDRPSKAPFHHVRPPRGSVATCTSGSGSLLFSKCIYNTHRSILSTRLLSSHRRSRGLPIGRSPSSSFLSPRIVVYSIPPRVSSLHIECSGRMSQLIVLASIGWVSSSALPHVQLQMKL